MKRSVTFILLFSISFHSSSQTLKELNDSVFKYFNSGEFDKAIGIAEKEVIIAKQTVGESRPEYVTSLNNLALLYTTIGQYEKAVPLYIETIGIRKKTLGEDHPDYANILNKLGLLYVKMGLYEKAEPIYTEAMAIRKKVLGENHPDYAGSLNNMAELYRATGRYEKAEPLYQLAVEIWGKALGEEHPNYALGLNNLAALYQDMGQYEKAEAFYSKAMAIRKKVLGENHVDYAASLNNMAELYRVMGQYEKAEPLYIQAIETWRKTTGINHPNYALSLNNLGGLYESMGQYERAEKLYIRAKEIWKNVLGENHPDYANSLNNLAELYSVMAQYEKAEPLYIQAKEIWEKVLGENHPKYATSLDNLGLLYLAIGQYQKAESLFIQAKEIREKVLGENHPDYATSLNNLAGLYHIIGQSEKAELLFLQEKEIRKKVLGENHPLYATCLNNMAELYKSMGQYEKAEPLYIQAKEIRKKVLGENHPDYATSLNNLATLYVEMGQYEKAESLFLLAKEIYKNVLGENHPDYATNLSNLATLYVDMDRYEKAEALILQSSRIDLQNLLNNFIFLSEKEKGNYVSNKISLLESNNSFIYNYKKASPSILQNNFNLQLIFKSITLADTRNVLNSIQQNPDTAVQSLLKDWQAGKSILAKQYSLPIASRRNDLKLVEARTENLEIELGRRSSAFRNQQNAIRISMQDVKKNLQQDEVAIEFVSFQLYNKKWTDSTIYAAYVLHKNDSVPQFVPLFEEKQLQQLLERAGRSASITAKVFYRGLAIKDKNTEQGAALYKLVWQPLEAYLKGIKKVSYSPAGKLYSIAFQALPVDSTTVLSDRYQLQQYTSIRQVALRNSENQRERPVGIALFGDPDFSMDSSELTKQKINQSNKNISTAVYTPSTRGAVNGSWPDLPGTAEEVKKIADLFDQNKINSQTFTKANASEENLKALSGNSPQILHIATHGFFLPEPDKKKKGKVLDQGNTYSVAEDPLLRSGLILAGGNYAWSGKTPVDEVEDGIATAYEISQLNLSKTELVVLSACETALGDVKGSEGVFGLQRALKIAGVKKMIVSLWKVPDKETAELMTTFYLYWISGKSINESFYQAQADMRKKYSPYYWAAFVLVE